ncbi:MAG TPA: glycoside hydrolase family 18 protein [Spirochaetia bacterium]|nr:glycoside hydrolase family 18 protein [Spirochaetia bacterium]
MLRKISFLFLSLALILTSVTTYYIWRSNLPLVSPIALIDSLIGNSPAIKSDKVVYGFFPYWNLKYSEKLNISSLTHFAYFAIDLNADGTINKKINSVETEPGWNKLKSKDTSKLLYQAKLLGQKTVITVTAMEPEIIEGILNSPENKERTISSIMSVYKDYDFDDINIDFEYVTVGNQILRDSLVDFISNLRSACISYKSHCQIDIDIFASAGEKPRIWDLKKLEPFVDKFIVMAYDYHRKSSSQAGPVAPLKGKCPTPYSYSEKNKCIEEDIITHLSLLSKQIPSNKIILGVPFYGYEWQTATKEYLSNTYSGTGALATYQRIQTLFQDSKISSLSAEWSSSTLSPYLIFQKDDKIFQIHFENAQSLEQKIKLVESANLGGVAIWALGYEGDSQDLWTPINSLFRH